MRTCWRARPRRSKDRFSIAYLDKTLAFELCVWDCYAFSRCLLAWTLRSIIFGVTVVYSGDACCAALAIVQTISPVSSVVDILHGRSVGSVLNAFSAQALPNSLQTHPQNHLLPFASPFRSSSQKNLTPISPSPPNICAFPRFTNTIRLRCNSSASMP